MREHIAAWPFKIRLGLVALVGLILFSTLQEIGPLAFAGLVVAACIFLFPGLMHRRPDSPPNG